MLRQNLLMMLITFLLTLTLLGSAMADMNGMSDTVVDEMEELTVEADQTRMIGKLKWHTDYISAYQEARDSQQNLFIVFEDDRITLHENFANQVLAKDILSGELENFVRVIIPASELTPEGDGALLEHASFRHMQGMSGIAVLDLSNPDSVYYNRLISAFPFSSGRAYSSSEVQTILGLPEASITQRTLIFALQQHPEGPRSGYAMAHSYLLDQARSHSMTMARMHAVGHHNWGYRFGQISRRVGPAREVAVSAYGFTLVDVAKSCVQTWRSSPGHWNSMRRNCRYMGYDMYQGAGGKWYATGIMAD